MVLKLLLGLHLLLFNLYACKEGLDTCRQKVLDSHSIVDGTLRIPIQKNQRLLYSSTPPKEKIIKYDPFLSLYLVQESKGFAYPFLLYSKKPSKLIGVDSKGVIEGKIIKKQVGLTSLATFSKPLRAPSLLLDGCCGLEGIVTERGIIEKAYIERFLKSKEVSYGDIGIGVEQKAEEIIVTSSNPFFEGNIIEEGDVVLEFDGKKVKESADLMQKILFSPIGSKHTLKIKRKNTIAMYQAITHKKMATTHRDDVALAFLGLSFDKNLRLVAIDKEAQRYGLKVGDRLLQANRQNIRTQSDIFKNLKEKKKELHLLFERDHFQFFVKVN